MHSRILPRLLATVAEVADGESTGEKKSHYAEEDDRAVAGIRRRRQFHEVHVLLQTNEQIR